MEFNYKPEGVCCKNMKIVVEDGKVSSVKFVGGCLEILKVWEN